MCDAPVPSRASLVRTLRAAGCVFAEEEAGLLESACSTRADLRAMVDRRVQGVPLEQIVGWAEFCGLRIAVEPGVFVPRRRSELLVREGAALVTAGSVVLDVCCGSGAIGAALARTVPGVELHAADQDRVAVRCAIHNVGTLGGRVHTGDLYEPLPSSLRGRVDLVLANAPYVPTGSLGLMPPEARLHEPAAALDGGADGTDVQRRVVAGAAAWLAPGGHLLVETSRAQERLTAEAFVAHGYATRVARTSEPGGTVVIGR